MPFGFTGGIGGPDDGAPFLRELERLLGGSTGPVNWELAHQIALHTLGVATGPAPFAGFTAGLTAMGVPTPAGTEAGGDAAEEEAQEKATQAALTAREASTSERAGEIADAVRLADLWLDGVTAFASGVRETKAWTRKDWVERTLPAWRALCEPVAARVVETMREGLSDGLSALGGGELPPEVLAMLPPGTDAAQLLSAGGPLLGMIGQLGGLMFGAQVGQALGTLAGEVLTSTDIGLPLGPTGVAALLPATIDSFAADLERPADQVLLWLSLREAAHHRLFTQVPWLRPSLTSAVEEYARGIDVDPEAVARAAREIDPTDPEALQQALGEGMFDVEISPAQQVALTRLERLLALVEGWVDHVVANAAQDRLPDAVALREALRRRRASGGPAEQTFATLVGLELRPRRLREAATLWAALEAARGAEGRDGIWATPDFLPTVEDLADPDVFVSGVSSDDGGVPDDPIAEIERLAAEQAAASGSPVPQEDTTETGPDEEKPDQSG